MFRYTTQCTITHICYVCHKTPSEHVKRCVCPKHTRARAHITLYTFRKHTSDPRSPAGVRSCTCSHYVRRRRRRRASSPPPPSTRGLKRASERMYVDIKYNNMLVCANVLVCVCVCVSAAQHNMAKVVSLLRCWADMRLRNVAVVGGVIVAGGDAQMLAVHMHYICMRACVRACLLFSPTDRCYICSAVIIRSISAHQLVRTYRAHVYVCHICGPSRPQPWAYC